MPEEPTREPADQPIRPLKDVWLRPRRVFRELAPRPVGFADYLLASAQGIGNCFVLYRSEAIQSHASAGEILVNCLRIGPIAGLASLFLFAAIYTRLGARAGGKSTRDPVFHVLAYGGIPVVVGLAIWALTALLVGDAAFVDTPTIELDGFLLVILRLQFALYVFLSLWSLVLQVMGFSEIQGLPLRKSFGIWVLGQALWMLALLVLLILLELLLPGFLPVPAT